MDLRAYYKKVRDVEVTIPSAYVVVVSLDTSDGGKAGVRTEASRHVAARQISEGKARLADDTEATEFREAQADERERTEATLAAQRMHVTIVAAPHESRASRQARSKD